jgi:AP-4 complex subunit mu-1
LLGTLLYSHRGVPSTRIANLCKDYCGVLTEESIRLNFVLIYELLDEVIDFG